jgi:glycosyltransferase involved in cell wall biosynthesis
MSALSPAAPAAAEPLVSVILPTHNRAGLLGRAIRSVLGQSYRNLELLVVDDASTDNTPDVVKSIDDARLRYIRLDQNRRAAAARNIAIKAARGELLAFQDDDDEWLPQKLERQVASLMRAPAEVGLNIGGFQRVSSFGERYIGGAAEVQKLDFSQCPACVDFALISTPNWLLRKSVLERSGVFDEQLKSLDDWELAMRLLDHTRLEHLDEALWIQNWALPTHAVMARNPKLIVHDYALLIAKYGQRWKASTLAQYAYQAGLIEAGQGRGREATRWFLRAFRQQPMSPKHLTLLLVSLAGPRAVSAVMSLRWKVRDLMSRREPASSSNG